METVSGEAKKTFTVRFEPDEVEVEVESGATILDAARKGGVFIDSICGGEGVCGKCRVVVRKGEIEGGTTEFFSRDEIRQGYVLACEARATSDLVVEVPPESRLKGRVVEVDIAEQRLSELALLEGKPVPLEPLAKRYCLEIPAPSLEYNEADLDRLEHALRTATNGGEFQMGLKVIRTLPDILRQADHQVTITTAYRGSLTEITQVSTGRTCDRNLALAVDVGTTTLAAHLVDLTNGKTLGRAAKYNSQAAFGADVIHRIIWSTDQPGGLHQLHDRIIGDINMLIQELVERLHLSVNDITFVLAAGNTTMMHILHAINPEWIRREPYVGVTYQPPPFRAAEVGITINPRGLLYTLPCVSAFVGADITAGVMAVGLDETEKPRMLIDVGTNGEIVVGNKDWMVCASASAGPAFEGGGTQHGMRATQGAIDHVDRWNGSGPLSYSSIGEAPPAGLCGTAYVDLLAELLCAGVMDKTGRLNPEHACKRVRSGTFETPEFVLVKTGEKGAERDIVVTQNDLTNLERAKGAIYAAEKVLLNSLKLRFSDLDEIMVAGAFGTYLDPRNAVLVGLLPDLPPEKLRFVGNTSIVGAKMAALNREQFVRARRIADSMTYFELSTDPTFMEQFTSACFFPHTDIEEFPSVQKALEDKAG